MKIGRGSLALALACCAGCSRGCSERGPASSIHAEAGGAADAGDASADAGPRDAAPPADAAAAARRASDPPAEAPLAVGSASPPGAAALYPPPPARGVGALGGDAATLVVARDEAWIELWDRAKLRPRARWQAADACLGGQEPRRRSWSSVAISAAGDLVAAGASGGMALFRGAAGQCLRWLEAPDAPVDVLAFSPDGSALGALTWDTRSGGTVTLWDTATGSKRHALHARWADRFAFVCGGKALAMASARGEGKVWDAGSGAERCALDALPGEASFAVLPDRPLPAGCCGAEPDGGAGEPPAWQLRNNLALSPDGGSYLRARDPTDGNGVDVVDRRTDKVKKSLSGPGIRVSGVAYAMDGAAVGASISGDLFAWDPATGAILRQLGESLTEVHDLARTPDGSLLAVAADRVYLFDPRTGEQKLGADEGRDRASCVALARDGRRLVSGHREGSLRVWDTETGSLLRALSGFTGWRDGVESLALAPGGDAIVTGHSWGAVRVWPSSGGPPRVLHRPGKPDESDGGQAVALADEGRVVLAAQRLNTLRAWDLKSGKSLWSRSEREVDVPEIHQTWFDASPDGKTVAASFTTREVFVLGARDGAPVRSLRGPDAPAALVRFASDEVIVAVAYDRTAYAWDAATGALRHKLVLPAAPGWSFAASPDRRTVALGLTGATLLWDIVSGEVLGTLPHSDRSAAALFAGPALLTGGGRGLQIWSTSSRASVATLLPTGGGQYAVISAAGAADATPHARTLFLASAAGAPADPDEAWGRHAAPGLLARALAGVVVAPP